MERRAEGKILVTGLESDASNRLHLHYLIKHSQILDMIHNEEIGLTSDLLDEKDLSWIIITNQIKLLGNRPSPKDHLVIESWISSIKGIKFSRENKYYLNEKKPENLIGVGSSSWILATKEDHKPVKPNKYFDKEWLQTLVAPEVACTDKIENLKSFTKQDLGQELLEYEISYGDLDINDHLNNTHYVRLSIDAFAKHIGFDYEKDIIEIENYIIKFEKEMFYGQVLTLYVHEKDGYVNIEGKNEKGKMSFLVKADFKIKKKEGKD